MFRPVQPTPAGVRPADPAAALADGATRTALALAPHDLAAPGGLVVGSDGRPETAAPLRLAAALTARSGEPVRVVCALPRSPVFAPGLVGCPVPDVDGAGALRAIRRLVADATGDPDAWPITLRPGRPGELLADAASARQARLLLVGLGLRRMRERGLGGENVLRIARQADRPVVAVAPGAERVPHGIVVGVDFGSASLRAARAALALVAEQGTVYLVHVRPPAPDARFVPEAPGYPDDLEPWFDRIVADLDAPTSVLVRPVVLRGVPAETLLDFAVRVRAECLAVGTQGPSPALPQFVGACAVAIARAARCSVLLAPPPGD